MVAVRARRAAASVYLVYVLEILKFRRFARVRDAPRGPDATEEIDAEVEQRAGDRRVLGDPGVAAGI